MFGEDQRVGEWAREHSVHRQLWNGFYRAIGFEVDGELMCGVGYTDHYSGGSIAGHITSIGQRWATRRFLYHIFAYPFIQLKVRRFNAFIPAKNESALNFAEHVGFSYESTMIRALSDDDVKVYRMFPEDAARWLKWRAQ